MQLSRMNREISTVSSSIPKSPTPVRAEIFSVDSFMRYVVVKVNGHPSILFKVRSNRYVNWSAGMRFCWGSRVEWILPS